MQRGTIIKNISNQYRVLFEDGSQKDCVAMGKLRKDKKPLVGDHVDVEVFEHQLGIQKILPRKNCLLRPAIANVDQAVIVMSSKDPDFSATLVDRLIFMITLSDITPVLCVSKMDLVDSDDPIYQYIEDYRRSGYQVVLTGEGDYESLADCFDGKISVLTGQSGAGKSSLLNRLNPEFELQTQVISKALGRGKHTTRHCQLYPIAQGWVADTPGFSSLDFARYSLSELSEKLVDFRLAIHQCRFRDCKHLNQPDCAVKKGVEEGTISKQRYRSYCEIASLMKK